MARIPQSFIDELVERSDIVDVIDSRVPLKRKGREYAACCPFHNEKTPSFYVSPVKQFYHCFGCGAHGTVLGFLMDYENMEFPDAVRELAERAGMEIPEGGPAPAAAGRDRKLREALAHADRFFRGQLRQSEQAKNYLLGRGIDGKTAQRFGLGWAPDRFDGLLHTAQDSELREALITTGMLIRKDDGSRTWDRFRGRVMFPIRDGRGRTVAFGGRLVGDGEPKYLNSPEHPLFHKGRELYGLHEARQARPNLDSLLITEGYMDVIALAQAGIDNAVATLGTATTSDQLARAFRTAERVLFCFDGDAAGRRAAWKALENALPVLRAGREVRFLFLPEGEDPDSLVRSEGREAFERRLKEAVPLSEWFRDQLAGDLDLAGTEGRAMLVDRAAPLLQRVRDPVYRELLSDPLAEAAGLSPERWRDMLAGRRPQRGERRETAPRRPVKRDTGRLRLTPVREALAVILQAPAVASRITIPEALDSVDIRGIHVLREMLEIARATPELDTARLLERWRERPEHPHLERLAATPIPGDEEALGRHLEEILSRLAGPRAVEARMEALVEKAGREGLDAGEKEELRALQQSRAEQ